MKSWYALANRFEIIFWTDRLTDGQTKQFRNLMCMYGMIVDVGQIVMV